MESIGNSPVFNFGGLATILSFFGINMVNLIRWADINIGISIAIGAVSLVYIVMKVYLTFLQTKKTKKELRKLEAKEKK